jgi:hypothetical protein
VLSPPTNIRAFLPTQTATRKGSPDVAHIIILAAAMSFFIILFYLKSAILEHKI